MKNRFECKFEILLPEDIKATAGDVQEFLRFELGEICVVPAKNPCAGINVTACDVKYVTVSES